jgi:hypothetical protein
MMTKDDALKRVIKALQNTMNSLEEKQIWYSVDLDEAINACKEALATNKESSLVQPAQEPVAWIKDWVDGNKELVPNKYDGSYPVYTHPAQPLSDDAVNELWLKLPQFPSHIDVVRTIEKAHRIGVKDG